MTLIENVIQLEQSVNFDKKELLSEIVDVQKFLQVRFVLSPTFFLSSFYKNCKVDGSFGYPIWTMTEMDHIQIVELMLDMLTCYVISIYRNLQKQSQLFIH